MQEPLLSILQNESDLAKRRAKVLDKLLSILPASLSAESEVLIWSMFMELKIKKKDDLQKMQEKS